ncbi:hypothetical protein LTR84_004625 [Exophiala bonariae]|uniref:Protein kinase domain-containing protein n=1 Tax=Exophiala bonariae TaxID=1690606 RepID=A0AAV9NPY0_9EURO|nr:hypothetical protein LTR84_004625 [Exophiala bonariae]
MHRKGRLGLLVDDGGSDEEIEFLSSGWLLPPVHDEGAVVPKAIKIQHIEWAGDVQTEFAIEPRDAQQSAASPWSLVWALAVVLLQAFSFGRMPQIED